MKAQGLYDPRFEHDACGVGFVARLDGAPDARGDQPRPDGAREPRAPRRRRRRRRNRRRRGHPLPAAGRVPPRGLGLRAAAASTASRSASCRATRRAAPSSSGCSSRRPPTKASTSSAGVTCRSTTRTSAATRASSRRSSASSSSLRPPISTPDAFERKLYVIRRVAELAAGADLVIPSFSSRTLVYKGMLTAPQLRGFYPDLGDERFASALALVHSRFSTNTFPSWELAHPYRMVAHNGEINTLRGNVNWMRARESQLASELFGNDMAKVLPGRPAGRLRHGGLRQRARAARARRPLAAARADDDGARRRTQDAPTCPTSCAASTSSTSA